MTALLKLSASVCLLLLLINSPSHASSKIEYIDSLLETAEINKSINKAVYKEALVKLENEIQNFNLEQSQQYKYFLAYEYSYKAEFNKAERTILEILNQKTSSVLEYKLVSLLLNIFTVSQQWENGAKQASKLISLPVDSYSSHHYQLSMLTLVAFYNQVGQPSKSFVYLDKVRVETLSDRSRCIFYQVDLEAKIEAKPLFVNDKIMIEAIRVCEAAEEYLFAGIIRVYLSEWLSNKEEYIEAKNVLLPFLPRLSHISYPILKAGIYNQLSLTSLKAANFSDAREFIKLAHIESEVLSRTKQSADTYYILYLLEEQKGALKEALSYYKKYTTAKDAYIDEVKAKTIAFQMAQHDEFAKLKEIELLNSENQRMALEAKLANTGRSNFYFLISFLLSVILVGGIWSYRSWLLKEKLRNIVEFDPLTGLLSRVYFNETAKKIIAKMEKKEKEVCCLIFDIDYFKQINDTYGHSGGDIVLKHIAEICEKLAPSNKLFGRIAGEEFALIFPDCSLLLAHGYAEDYKSAILALDLSNLGISPSISASFGITSTEISGYDFDKIMGDADSAMYSSKNHGRNKVTPYRKAHIKNN